MILEITKHSHPALRSPGAPVAAIDDRVRELALDMIDTMRDADGLGLAAQQVGLPMRMFVLDVPSLVKRPSVMRIGGREVDFEELMPLVLLNAEVRLSGPVRTETEGCLSFPDLSAEVPRPQAVAVKAMTLDGETLEFEAEGLLARAVQHEFDHTRGVLFIDRATPEDRASFPPEVSRLVRPPADA